MRKFISLVCAFMMLICAQGQAPAQLNYQGVARKTNGHPLDNEAITLRLTIRDGSAIGPVVYSERRSVMTNEFGLFNVAIGSPGATFVTGSIATVNWATGSKYMQVEMDPNGGSSFLNMGTQQLLSVPYALNASGAAPIGPAGGDLSGTYPNPTVARIRGVNVNPIAPLVNNVLGYNGINWTPTSLATHPENYWRMSGANIYNANAGNVGIGINTPLYKLDVNGTSRMLGFVMPTGAGDGKFLRSDGSGVGSWSSSIAATSLVLPYKDSASSESDNIFHIIQTSLTSGTGALYGETRSAGANSFAVGGSANNGIGVKGLSNTDYGVYGTSNLSSAVFGHSLSGAGYRGGVFGYSTSFGGNGTFGYATMQHGFGALGISESSTGVYGQTNSPTFSAFADDGAAVYALATSGGTGVFSNSNTGIAGRFESLNPLNSSNLFEAVNNGTARAGWFENTNAANSATTLFVTSNGTGRAIVGRSQMPGFVNGGVIDGLSNTVGGNAVFGRGTRSFAWGIYGLSDSAAGVAGIGFRPGSVGVLGQGWGGTAAQFIIDNTNPNTSNTVEISNTQSGNGLLVDLNNSARGIQVTQAGNGIGVFSNSNLGRAARFENTNASNFSTTLEVISNGNARAIYAQSDLLGPVNGGVVHALTTVYGSNAFYARATKPFGWGVASLSDSSVAVGGIGYRAGSVGVLGQGWGGTAGQFIIDNTLVNTSNTVEVSNTQSGNGVVVTLNNSARGVQVDQNGNGIGVLSNSNLGLSGRFENTNAANSSTTLEVVSNGTGRAIFAQSNLPGPVFGGVIHSHTATYGSNAYYARATKQFGWGVASISDSSVAIGGIGVVQGSVGIFGQGYRGVAGQFLIDGTNPNTSNTVEVVNTQSGNGVVIDLNNSARGLDVMQGGNGLGIYSNSSLGIAARFENTNAGNATRVIDASTIGNGIVLSTVINNPGGSSPAIYSNTNGFGNAVYGISDKGHGIVGSSQNGGYGSAGVYGSNSSVGGNGLVGLGNQIDDWGLLATSNLSIGVYGQSNTGNAAYFTTIGSASAVPTLYSLNNGLSNVASFNSNNLANTADAVTINRVGAGRSLFVTSSPFHNPMDFYNPATSGIATVEFEGRSGLGLFAHATGSFEHPFGVQRVGIGAYGIADSIGSQFNYGLVGNARGGSLENAGVIGWISNTAAGSNVNAAIYGYAFPTGPAPRYAGLFEGNVHVTGILSKGGGAFRIDHPMDPENKYLVHSFVESPDMMNVYNGNATTNADGKVIVDLPSYFEAENIDFKYQLTVIGQFAQAIIGEEVKDNKFVILTDKPNVKVSWQVTGVRNDKFAQKNRIVPEVDKKGDEIGRYLNPELYGQSERNGINFLKSGLPQFGGEEKVSSAKKVSNTEQDAVNTSVQRKSALVNDQVTQIKPVEAINTTQEKKRTSFVADEKMKMMDPSLDQTQTELKLKPVEKKEQAVNIKTQNLYAGLETAETKVVEQKATVIPEPKKADTKMKQLSSDTEVKTEASPTQKSADKKSPIESKKLAKPAETEVPRNKIQETNKSQD